MVDLSNMTTESTNANTHELDSMSISDIVTVINQEDAKVIKAVELVKDEIVKAIEMTVASLKNGGRLIYIGAGTSGRLGVLDAVECPPTFGTDYEQVIGVIAGGDEAFVKAKEGAEDSRTLCEEELKKINLSAKDMVIGITASGRTPYVYHGLKYAKSLGCSTAGLACNLNPQIAEYADVCITPIVGPEVLTGSTRMKAGSAQKMVLNMISTVSMIGIGKVYKNYMVDLKSTNEKLITRAQNIVMSVTGCSRELAKQKISEANNHVKTAIVMILLDCDLETAINKLELSGGHVRKALE